MKANKSSKNFRTATRILTIVICIGIAFSLISIQPARAFIFTIGIAVGLLIIGGFVGWVLHDQFSSQNVFDNPALQLTEENLLNAWRDKGQTVSNQYKENNVDVLNFVNLFNISYLYWVRMAENEVANVIDIATWYDAKQNMTSFDDFDNSLKDLILSQVAKYASQDIYIFRDILETNGKDTVSVKDVDGNVINSTFTYGLRPIVTDRNTEWYLVDIYIPAGESLKIDGDLHGEGIYQFQAQKYTLSEITSDSILITGFPTDYDIFTRKNYNTTDKITGSYGHTQYNLKDVAYINRKINTIYFDNLQHGAGGLLQWIDYYGNIHLIDVPDGDVSFGINTYVRYIRTAYFGGAGISFDECRADIEYNDIFYRPEPITITVDTSIAGSIELAEHLTDRDKINFYDVIIPYMKTLKNGMELNAQTLFNLYHSHGWFNTDDIPSNYLVVMPDLLFDNIYALAEINITEAMLIYYTLLKQLDNQTLWVEPDIDSGDISISDFGKWMVKGKLVHSGDTIFDDEWVWVIPQSKTLYLENNTSIVLNQSVMFFIPSSQELYMGYLGDSLDIYMLLEDGEVVEDISITRQSLREFLIANYGFDISLFAEWEFPELVEGFQIYITIAVALICLGIPTWLFGGKYKKIGILMVAIGIGIIVLVYIIPMIQTFIDYITFW